jgi:hypothetical protein
MRYFQIEAERRIFVMKARRWPDLEVGAATEAISFPGALPPMPQMLRVKMGD